MRRRARKPGYAMRVWTNKAPGNTSVCPPSYSLWDSPVVISSRNELIRGVRGMLGKTLRIEPQLPGEPAFLLGTLASVRQVVPDLAAPLALREDGFWLTHASVRGFNCVIVTAANDRGVLYGVFSLLSRIAREEPVSNLDAFEQPAAPV